MHKLRKEFTEQEQEIARDIEALIVKVEGLMVDRQSEQIWGQMLRRLRGTYSFSQLKFLYLEFIKTHYGESKMKRIMGEDNAQFLPHNPTPFNMKR